MKRTRIAVLITGVIGTAMTPAVIRAQTVPTPTPTTAAANPLPGGKHLITQMYAVMHRVKTVRVSYSGSFTDQSKESGGVSGTEDLGVRSHVMVLHESQTLTPLQHPEWATNTVFDEILTKRTDAVRSDYQLWFCYALRKHDTPSYQPIMYWHHIANAVNHGAMVVDGVPTWHVTALNVVEKPSTNSAIVTNLDYYIAQDTHRLVRQDQAKINSAIYAPGNYHLFTLTFDFSQYGEKVAAKIPKGCRAAKS